MSAALLESPVIRRVRPLLGAKVEISATGLDPEPLQRAIEAAFLAVDRVQQLMSYHDPLSELSQLNHAAHREAVTVSPWTYTVLRTAQQLAAESEGAFDITIAPRLAAWGYLPRVPANGRDEMRATWRDLDLLPGRRVSFQRPLHIDLGGIAKGFAVDRAIEALQRAGVSAALVNASGDLRAFGERDWPVEIRNPSDPGQTAHSFTLRNSAISTSTTYYSRKRWRKCWVCPLVDGTTRLPCDDQLSVSVQAPTALLADALTKVVAVRREQSAPILQRHRASAMLLDREGRCQHVATRA